MRDHEAFWLIDGKAKKEPEEVRYRNLGYALRAHPDLFERYAGEVRDAMTRYIRTLDPADLERHNRLAAVVRSELAGRGARWPKPMDASLGWGADTEGGIDYARGGAGG